jgi:Domain of unknown function (DUF4145)
MQLGQQLPLERCPYCRIHRPNLSLHGSTIQTHEFGGGNPRHWGIYVCRSCGGLVVAWASSTTTQPIQEVLPKQDELSDEIPSTARKYLHQAQDSLHAPDGAVMLAASAVDAMLKAKGYQKGSLYSRIKEAAEAHLITPDMALWAHHIRLGANNPRHVDEDEPHATAEGARQAVEFAAALANILFVLPSRVTRGLKEAGGTPVAEGGGLPEG